MVKPSAYQRSLTWAARKRLVRRNVGGLTVAFFVAIGLDTLVTLSLGVVFPRIAPFVLEALILIELGLLWFWLLIHDGELLRRLGVMGETWSKDELAWLKKRGWSLFNNLSFEHFDVDHVLIGPGGVIAFETKLSVRADAQQYVASALRQSADAAHKTALLLRSYDVDVVVNPVLFLWGPGYRDVHTQGHPATVVLGNDVRSWVRGLVTRPRIIDQDTAARAADAIKAYQSKRQKYEASKNSQLV